MRREILRRPVQFIGQTMRRPNRRESGTFAWRFGILVPGHRSDVMVLLEGIELSTSPLPRECSTTELQQPNQTVERFLASPPHGCKCSSTHGGLDRGRERGEVSRYARHRPAAILTGKAHRPDKYPARGGKACEGGARGRRIAGQSDAAQAAGTGQGRGAKTAGRPGETGRLSLGSAPYFVPRRFRLAESCARQRLSQESPPRHDRFAAYAD